MIDGKTQKYDRQLRLWKSHGQQALESSHICLLGCSVAGTEALKNLILPGIQAFTIVDDQKVTEADLGRNFFLDKSQLGHDRAEALCMLLQELNEDVDGYHVTASPSSLIESNPDFFKSLSMIIVCTHLSEQDLISLERLTRDELKIPLVLCKAFGFVGYMRLSLPQYSVIESHAQTQHDLRINSPWDELRQHAMEFDLKSLSQSDKGQIPYVVLLIQALESLKYEKVESVNRNLLKQRLFSIIGNDENGELVENLEEANSQLYRALGNQALPSHLKSLFENELCSTLNEKSDKIWIKLKALKMFYDEEGVLPLSGTVPDMKADTNNYISLQQIYRNKSLKDQEKLHNFIITIAESLGLPKHFISDEEVQILCKNASNIRVFDYRRIEDEIKSPKVDAFLKEINCATEVKWLLCFHTMDKFKEMYKRYPGESGADVESDVSRMKKILIQKFGQQFASCGIDENIYEFCRASNAELHNISSLLGGIMAQECLKLITNQYVPLNNTMIFDGMSSTCWTYSC